MTSRAWATCLTHWGWLVAGLVLPGLAGCGDDDLVPLTGIGSTLPRPSRDAGADADAAGAPDPCAAALGCQGADCPPGCDEAAYSQCGNGKLDPREECDDGNTRDRDSCSASCLIETCGNGRVDPGETCDRIDASCTPLCQTITVGPEGCGDSVAVAGEDCDDGNVLPGDGCSPVCLLEECGNARLDNTETCDPPDGVSCDDVCQRMRCGDGHQDQREQCDDGNNASGDGCSGTCLREICGDGAVNQGPAIEQCEPPGQGACDPRCRTIACGNGLPQGLEQCDDGNTLSGDGCSDTCRKEGCGNAELDPGEDCEPPGVGNCDLQCHAVRVRCGDGLRQAGEECDDGNLAFGDGCSPSCQAENCGNGRIEGPFEGCEPPGTAVCNVDCRVPRCGDGSFDQPAGEECEDGNIDNGDGCSATCRVERCGNGRLEAPEQCEPPGTLACDADCRALSSAAAQVLLPVGADLFRLRNPAFENSLAPWQLAQSLNADVEFSPLDLGPEQSSSGAALLTLAGAGSSAQALVIGNPDGGPALGQCVRTTPGASYHVSLRASVPAGQGVPVSLQLGARFHSGADCSGGILDGVSSEYVLDETEQPSELALPPGSPVSGFNPSFTAPFGAGSMLIWMQLVEQDSATSVLIDSVALDRTTAAVCGDGIPEADEECEPGITLGCTAACRLPVVCGDSVAAPQECNGAPGTACPADCPKPPAVCGDGNVAAPEECDPPGQNGTCSAACTTLHGVCGDRRVAAASGEECDPPDGAICDLTCKSLHCGDGTAQPPEECDPPGAACSLGCRALRSDPRLCGDGLLQDGEACDPPNAETWCSSSCQRRNPKAACGDSQVDIDLGEQCDPPGYASNCGLDCRRPVCGDGKVTGAEHCDPPNGDSCGTDCRFPASGNSSCQACLASTCSGPAPAEDLFSACFGLEGVAQAGPAKDVPLRQLCTDLVECMRRTGCDSEVRPPFAANLVSCYCGKSIFDEDYTGRLRACRDGVSEPRGACREAFERAAESALPGAVLTALDRQFGKPALTAATRLMSECGHAPAASARSCTDRCSVQKACGNGVVEPGEMCDPKDPEWGDKGSRWPQDPGHRHPLCDPTYCSILPCGDGHVDTKWPYDSLTDPTAPVKPVDWIEETCDVADPYTSSQCDTTCHVKAVCGDGKLTASVEACDPGPDASWAGCCRPGDVTVEGRTGCDPDESGTIEPREGCVAPSVCGNSKREGSEQCDPPAAGKCDDKCRRVESGPCAECTNLNCGPKYKACYDAEPSAVDACTAVSVCIEESGCRDDSAGTLPCLCGDQDSLVCQSLGGTGACRELMARNSGCGVQPASSCVYNQQLDPTHPTGAAAQLIQCRMDFCQVECFP